MQSRLQTPEYRKLSITGPAIPAQTDIILKLSFAFLLDIDWYSSPNNQDSSPEASSPHPAGIATRPYLITTCRELRRMDNGHFDFILLQYYHIRVESWYSWVHLHHCVSRRFVHGKVRWKRFIALLVMITNVAAKRLPPPCPSPPVVPCAENFQRRVPPEICDIR